MEFIVHPLVGVNDIRFGMPVRDVREIMQSRFQAFRRHPGEPHESDYFGAADAFCYYDADGHLEAMEFARGAHVSLKGVAFFETTYERFAQCLTRLDPHCSFAGNMVLSTRLSLAQWLPFADECGADEPAESVLVGRPGYYGEADPAQTASSGGWWRRMRRGAAGLLAIARASL